MSIKKRIMLYLTDEQYVKIKALADKDNRSLNNFCLTILEKYLEEAAK
jgi:uncharacterized protein (DUF1778 family)